MDGRLRDLMWTADGQVEKGATFAALDTYRTAVGEIAARLDKYRDSPEAPTLIGRLLELDPSNETALQLRAQLLPPPPAMPEPPPAIEVEAPPPVPPLPRPVIDLGPIEPPSFHLVEDDPSMLERKHSSRRYPYPEEPPLSILDPKPRPEPAEGAHGVIIGFLVAASLLIAIAFGLKSRVSPLVSSTPVEVSHRMAPGVNAPVLVYKENPIYSDHALRTGRQGTVTISLTVDPEGFPERIRVIHGLDPELDRLARAAVGRWRFQPATRNGIPVAMPATVEVNFRLR